jgi:uncharacterized protein YigE (DUF2233 family)
VKGRILYWLWAVLLLGVGCESWGETAVPTPIMVPEQTAITTPTPTAATITPAATEVATATTAPAATIPPDSGWQTLRPGLERRVINLSDGQGNLVESIYLLRLEPDRFEFRLGYRPGQPQSLHDWQAETDALLVVNGGYFTENYMATGLIVMDGVASGVGYGDFAGMFTITDSGPEIRWLRQRPYSPHESLRYALQSFPLLVRPDGQSAFPDEDGRRSRRTVVGQDGNGRLLFLVTNWGHFTLHQLSQWLDQSDLDLHIALNLDGGTSSGLLLAEPAEHIPAFILLPLVITVHAANDER